MKFVILNGSPKGERSVTMQSMEYLKIKESYHTFETIHIIQKLKKYEEHEETLLKDCEKIKGADGIIWAFPVYHLLVPSHYKRFIELIFENKMMEYFKGKYTSVFSTSIHYYDTTAHEYMRSICEDLEMNYLEGLSHHMNDLLNPKRREEILLFFQNMIYANKEKLRLSKHYHSIEKNDFLYTPKKVIQKMDTDKKIIIVTDAKKEDRNICRMIQQYMDTFKNKIEIFNLNEISMKGPCLGCCKCAKENICVYHEKDGYRKFIDYVLEKAHVIIYAGTIKDRYLSSTFKRFYDRSFCYTHIPYLKGKQIGYMISGGLKEIPNLRQILEVYTQQGANLIGFVTDEEKDSSKIDEKIVSFAKLTKFYSERNYFRATNFLGVSGHKIFRDAVAGELGAIFLGDYQYYKENKLFDFLTLKEKIKYSFRRFFFRKEKVRKEIDQKMIDLMMAPHKIVLEEERKME
ncbi:MAG: NAD(P)H-dependent oxidoreductase [Marinisporobacter sp.]|jgi:multimeric flavodoxin WrbA|nr:NAD(P)H-dependent oxidoreductase [Marinisporobacter sp.]